MIRPALRPETIEPQSPSQLISCESRKTKKSMPSEARAMSAEATYTPACRPFRSWAKLAPSFARTVKMPAIEQKMPRPARQSGADASLRASATDSSLVIMNVNAAAAPSAIVARIEP